ncbi:hypothetical protein F4802DRAFT_471427 [Xylaria palmicola]|nr:hypothetical protein F4802DRAFT_471427 [Xylaria palmicola]
MDPLSTPANKLHVDQKKPYKTENNPSNLEGPTADIDRKTKKRIQNRVAQRTYRTRIKQRLQDLQQQVNTLQKKEGEKQHDSQTPEIKIDDSNKEDMNFGSPFAKHPASASFLGQRKDEFSLGLSCPDISGIQTAALGAWAGIPSQPAVWNPPLDRTRNLYGNPFPVPARPPIYTVAGLPPTNLPIDSSSNSLHSHTSYADHSRNRLAYSHEVEENPYPQVPHRADNTAETNEQERIGNFPGFNTPYPYPLTQKLELRFTPESTAPATPAASVGPTMNIPQSNFYPDEIANTPMSMATTSCPENALPSPQATVEERFEYVLGCARRVGFDNFDTMASQYYLQNFHPDSKLAKEQQTSRSQHVPELLAELRKQAPSWGPWERRRYQDETLREVHDICAEEYSEFRKFEAGSQEEGAVSEAALGYLLPNLWVLLTGLVSNNTQLSRKQVSDIVFTSMRHLYGLEGPRTQMATSSRQSPR